MIRENCYFFKSLSISSQLSSNVISLPVNTYNVQVWKTHLNATVGITAKAIIMYRTALEVLIATTEDSTFNQESKGSNSTRKNGGKTIENYLYH